jgi:Insect allergen related repeat, nitrile-specifier detoxification
MFKLIISSVLFVTVTRCVVSSGVEPIIHVQSSSGSSLQSDINEFMNIIPMEEIRNLTKFFYANDIEMRDSYDYLRDKGFKMAVENLSQLSLLKKFTSFLNETGVSFAEMAKRMEKIVLTSEEAKSIPGNCSDSN